MLLQQISVFIENQPGHLAEVCDILASKDVDISALSLADTSDFGILRLIVDQPDIAAASLREKGFIVKATSVLAVAMDDQPGGLASILRSVTQEGISIEYMYAFVGKEEGRAVVVIRVSDTESAISALKNDGKTIITSQEVYRL